MKKIQILSMIMLVIGITCHLLWQFAYSVPDSYVRVTGIILITALFLLGFSSAKLFINKKK